MVKLSKAIRSTFLTGLIAALLSVSGAAQSSQPQNASNGAPGTEAKQSPIPAPKAQTDAAEAAGELNAAGPDVPGLDMKSGIPTYETIQEDWNSLEIGVSKLEPEKPSVSDVDQEEKFSRQMVSVRWRPGDPIDLWISLPKGVKNPPVVLYLYDFREDSDRFRNNAWCERVTNGGVAAVGFVSALSGHRFHGRPMKQWFVSELQESLGSTVHDAKFILDYLASRGDLDMSRVGMFGQGSGATIAILAAAADPRIKAIDLLEPWGDWPHFLAKSSLLQLDPAQENRDNYTKPEFLKKVEPLEPVKYLPQLKIPMRMQQVKDNDAVPMESKEALKDALPKQAQLRRFDTATTMFHQERGGELFAWVADQVKHLPAAAADTPAEQKPVSLAGRDAAGPAATSPAARAR